MRTLLETEAVGALATHSVRNPGWPFASVMPFALTGDASPLFLISGMAIHTQNLLGDPRASLLVTQSGSPSDPLGSSRVTILGNVTRVAQPDPAERELYLSRHPSARYWVDFSDFGFFRMEVTDVYFVGGFGVMGWVETGDYRSASPDPLMTSASGIIEHMNADHSDALLAIVRHFDGREADEATMTAVDRLGFNVRMKTSEGIKGARIAFSEPVQSSGDARRVLVAMTRTARGS